MNPYISLEDEANLRVMIRNVYKHEGYDGILQVMGELSTSLKIVAEVANEIMKEEDKRNGFNL